MSWHKNCNTSYVLGEVYKNETERGDVKTYQFVF